MSLSARKNPFLLPSASLAAPAAPYLSHALPPLLLENQQRQPQRTR